MIYIYRPQPSNGARLLAAELAGKKVSKLPRKLTAVGDRVIAWGAVLPEALRDHCPTLNGTAPLRNKLTDAQILANKDVNTIEVSTTEKEGWLPRLSNHVGGNDLLSPPAQPDFWTKKLDIRREFRIHSFLGHTIRAGEKILQDEMTGVEADEANWGPDLTTAHPWVRTLEGGWRISYKPNIIKQKHRDIAHAAVKALGLDFGAVDIGELKGGKLVVLEVNRAPGLEGGTITNYAKAIKRWEDGTWQV